MKFWQKTYVLTLVLFLVCLNGGIFALVRYTYSGLAEAEERTCRAQFAYLAQMLEAALEDDVLSEGGSDAAVQIMDVFGKHYRSQGIRVMFLVEGKTVYSSFLGEVPYQKDTLLETRLEGVRHFLGECALGDTSFRVVMGKEIGGLDDTFCRLAWVFLGVSALVSVLLAVGLYWLLKRLSAPLSALQTAAEAISAGDLSVRAREGGKDEFARLSKSFNGMVEKLQEQMALLEREALGKQMLVNNMAHELRTPLTGIRGYAEFLLRAAAPEETKLESARCIVEEANRLERISRTLLDTAYLQAEGISFEETDGEVLLRQTAERFRERFIEREIELKTDLRPCKVMGDDLLLSLLLDNLTENALKSGASRVILSCGDGTVAVSDNGRGMTEEQLSHITEPFYRTDKSRSRGEGGTGLGLAFCKQIALAHGAKLQFVSVPGEGTTVTVEFERRKDT